jgi:hypothetical protein
MSVTEMNDLDLTFNEPTTANGNEQQPDQHGSAGNDHTADREVATCAVDKNTSVLDNYEPINTSYTRGIHITACSLNGGHQFTMWEFSGYEPYQLVYDKFIGGGDTATAASCIHMLVYNLNQTQQECFDECVYWLEYLRSRFAVYMKASDSGGGGFLNLPPVRLLVVATHADLERGGSCAAVSKDTGLYTSEKARLVRQMLEGFYRDDTVFDLSGEHFVLDSRAAWTADLKCLIDSLVRHKEQLCEQLPKCTMLLNRTLAHIQMWRKQLHTLNAQPQTPASAASLNKSMSSVVLRHSPTASLSVSTVSTPSSTIPSTPTTAYTNNALVFQFGNLNGHNQVGNSDHPSTAANNITVVNNFGHYPIMSWKQFVDEIRESINPLASDEHLGELVAQLHAMGEVVYVTGGGWGAAAVGYLDADMICYQPEWLCGTILGRLLAHERYLQVRPGNLSGLYTLEEVRAIYADVCANVSLLVDIFLSFGLCTEMEKIKSMPPPPALAIENNDLLLYPVTVRSELVYEFPAFNFLSEPLPLAFHTIKACHGKSVSASKASGKKSPTVTCFVFNGFQIRPSHCHVNKQVSVEAVNRSTVGRGRSGSITAASFNGSVSSQGSSVAITVPPSQLASLFFKIQVYLR